MVKEIIRVENLNFSYENISGKDNEKVLNDISVKISEGEKKRVSIADIISMEPEVIIFDEPTASLDPVNVDILKGILKAMSDDNKTIMISTHDVDFAYEWAAICIPFLLVGFFSIKKSVSNNRKTLIILAMTGAFIFVLSSLKIPSVTGSCSHMTGTGLGAILYGPAAVSILGIIVLIFQATLLAHGGFTTLGANTFSMAIAGPLVSYGIYKLGKKLKLNKHFVIFLAASIGDLFTYCVTSLQLGLAYPSADGGIIQSMIKFLGIFAITQLPLAILEGILTVLIVMGLETYAKPELMELGYEER